MNIDLYAYLLLGLFFFAIWLVCFYLRRDLRSMMWKTSLIGAVSGTISEYWYFQDYWLPPTIVGQGVPSPEDVLFGFAVMGVAAVALAVVTGKRFTASHTPRPFIFFLFFVSIFAGFAVFTDILGINSIYAFSLTMLLWTAGLLLLRPKMTLFAIGNGALLAIFSIIIYVALLGVAVEYLQRYWFLWGTPLGTTIFGGVPVTEIVWYFCLGTALAVVAPYAEGKGLK